MPNVTEPPVAPHSEDPSSNALATQAASRYRWSVVFMLWFVCLFNYADRQAVFSVFPKLQLDLHFDKFQLGLIGSAFMWVYAAGAPFAGYIADRMRRKDLILGGCLFWSSITITTGWCSKIWQFVMVRALEGVGETFYFPASMSLMSDYHGKTTRSRALAFHQSSVYVGTIAGSWIGAIIAEKYNWRYGFYLFGALGMVLAMVLYRTLKEPMRGMHVTASPSHTNKSSSFSFMLKPTVILLMLAFLLANLVATVFLTWTPTYLVEKFHFKLSAAGLSAAVYIQVASAIAVPLAGLLADRLAQRMRAGRIVVQAMGLLVGASFVAIVGSTTGIPILITAMIAFGFCKGFYDSGIFASLFDSVAPAERGAAAGLMNTVGWGGGALGPLIVGWVSKHGEYGSEMANMSHAITFGGLIYVMGAALLIAAAITATRERPLQSLAA